MKILHLNMDFLPSVGGAQMSVHQLALGQTQAGHQVSILTNRKSAKSMSGHLPYDVVPAFHRTSHMFRAKDSWLKKLFFSMQVNWRSRSRKFDICHLHGALPEGNFLEAFQKKGTKVVMTLRGDDIGIAPEIGYGARLDPLKNAEIVKRIKQSDRMIALTEHWANELLQMGANYNKIDVIPNGIRLENFQAPLSSRTELRAAYGLDSDEVAIASIGRNTSVKGYDVIPPAVSELAKRGRKFIWILIGPKSVLMEKEIKRLGLKDYIRTHPPIRPSAELLRQNEYILPSSEMVNFLKAMDIIVIPSLSEVCCNAALEALAAGTALIGSDIPGINFILDDGVNGLVFPPKDVKSLVDGLDAIITNDELRKRLAAEGPVSVQNLSWQNVVGKHLELYKDLIE